MLVGELEADARGWRTFAEACDGAHPNDLVTGLEAVVGTPMWGPALERLDRWMRAAADVTAPAGLTALAGILVGYGTRLGNGCTSGHGVCGLARFSRRSLVATVSFIAAGAATVLIVRTLGGVG